MRVKEGGGAHAYTYAVNLVMNFIFQNQYVT